MEFNENNINEAESFLKEKMSGKVLNFNDFVFESNVNEEEDGYGQQPFFFAENGDTDNYFFRHFGSVLAQSQYS